MGQFDSTRVKKHKAIKISRVLPLLVNPTLDLLREDDPLLLISECHFLIEFHPWFLLLDLHHVIQICNFHGEVLTLLAVLASSVLIASTCFSLQVCV